MKTYICKYPIELSRKDFDRINKLFKVNFDDESPEMEALIDELYARPNTNPCTFWWEFEDGATVQLNIESDDVCYMNNMYIIQDDEDDWMERMFHIEEEMTIISSDKEREYVCKIKILEDK